MPLSSNIKLVISGQVVFQFDSLDAVERLRDCLQDGFNATPRNQLFSDDIEELIEELTAILNRFGN